jgi:hypothetical protein
LRRKSTRIYFLSRTTSCPQKATAKISNSLITNQINLSPGLLNFCEKPHPIQSTFTRFSKSGRKNKELEPSNPNPNENKVLKSCERNKKNGGFDGFGSRRITICLLEFNYWKIETLVLAIGN